MRDEEIIINSRDFDVFYQPIIDTRTGCIVSAEALIRAGRRWKENDTPSTLVNFAENNNIVDRIDRYVLSRVCQMISDNGLIGSGLTFHVNVSPVELEDGDIIKSFRDIADDFNVPYQQILFEVLETRNMTEHRYSVLNKLRAYGFKIGIDDYGSGFSSVKRLTEFKFDCVKISKQMFDKIQTNEIYTYMYRKIIEGLNADNIKITQEGVETMKQYNFVKDAGVGCIQGYYISKAVPENEFMGFLRNNMVERIA